MGLTRKLLISGGVIAGCKLAGDLAVGLHETGEVSPPGKRIGAGGLDLHYEEAGAGDPVVLLHGLGASTFCFRRTIPDLATRFRVLALDLPGYGFSTRDAPDQSLTAQAGYVLAFLDALGIEKASLVGHSMGGGVAQRVALTAPDRVERLVLADSTTDAVISVGLPLNRALLPFIPLAMSLIFRIEPVRRRWLAVGCYDSAHITPEVLAGYAAPSRMRGHVRAFQRFLVDRARDDAIDPSRIDKPTLLVWGEADRVVSPAIGRELSEQIAGSRLVIVPRAGHWSVEERPDLINPLLLEFLGRES